MLAIDIISTIKKVPSLSRMPDNAIMALIAVAAVIICGFVFLAILLILDFAHVEKEEHKAPDSHRLIMDLQHTLINEMKGTSKQNTLMINLTVIFIIITFIGIVASLLGPANTMKLIRQIGSLFSKGFSGTGNLIGK